MRGWRRGAVRAGNRLEWCWRCRCSVGTADRRNCSCAGVLFVGVDWRETVGHKETFVWSHASTYRRPSHSASSRSNLEADANSSAITNIEQGSVRCQQCSELPTFELQAADGDTSIRDWYFQLRTIDQPTAALGRLSRYTASALGTWNVSPSEDPDGFRGHRIFNADSRSRACVCHVRTAAPLAADPTLRLC